MCKISITVVREGGMGKKRYVKGVLELILKRNCNRNAKLRGYNGRLILLILGRQKYNEGQLHKG